MDETTGSGLLICAQGQDPDEEEGDDASIHRLRAAKGDPSQFEAVNVSPVIRYYGIYSLCVKMTPFPVLCTGH